MKEIDWRILIVLFEKRSMTKAAEELFMTQSALTKRVQSMENEWNVSIVRRTSQGVVFTEEGKYLVRKANIMLDFLREIQEHFAEKSTLKELLKIGVPNSFARIYMPGLLKEYMTKYNKLQIKTIPNSSDNIIRQLTDGNIDIGIICGDYPYIGEKVCLFEENMYIVAPKNMTLEDIEHLPLIESYFNPMVKLTVNQWWKNHFGYIPHESHWVPYADIAIEMVENGLGVTFVFGSGWKVDDTISQRIPVFNNNGEPVTRKVWMMVADTCFRSQDIMDFITLVEEVYDVNGLEGHGKI